ncbi:DEKNAAC103459 [Brettanomyces naardenensis]|uniref:DEKNAAC103459 n=1 Tax=Brettanomyces naardenensis TaxID=13370 RepID=A0A448YNS9_BRENA|nr:DEKNAAC103459 [Brettanomyces naardenensis]
MSDFDLYRVAGNYLQTILAPAKDANKKVAQSGNSQRIRVLLLDNQTSSIISMITTQSELLRHEIYLIDKLENSDRDNLRNLPCICFLKPSDITVSNLCNEIGSPRYKNYEIYFNNVVSKPRLERLAESDDLEIVTKVAEVFQDYYTVNKALYTSVNIANPLGITTVDTWDPESFDTALDSVVSLLLSFKLKPVIRYESNSKMATKLASSVGFEINNNSDKLFDEATKKDIAPLLLILDRKNDPITPLLFPWTYQSMIHEVFGIKNNTVDLSALPNVSEELKTVVLNETQDQFYHDSMYLNFGELSESLKRFIDKYREKTKTNSSLNSIKDMKFFLENYPEFKKTSLNVSKHMLLSSEIDKKINEWRMWEVSEFEQTMVSNSDHSHHQRELEQLEALLFDRKNNDQGEPLSPLSRETKLKLLSLYALKYEKYTGNETSRLLRMLKKDHFPDQYIQFIAVLLKYAGSSKRLPNDDDSIFDRVANSSGTLINGLTFGSHGDSSNVYMQHIPRLQNILMKVAKCKLNSSHYPYVKGGKQIEQEITGTGDRVSPQEIVIFIVGGVTYEEARLVAELNKTNSGLRCLIGGTHIPSTNGFVENLVDSGSTWGAAGLR